MSQMYFAFLGLFCADALAVQSLPSFLAFARGAKRAVAGVQGARGRAGAGGRLQQGCAPWRRWCARRCLAMARAAADDSWGLPLTAAEQQAMEWVRQNDARSGAAGHQPYAHGQGAGRAFEMYSGLSGRRFYMEELQVCQVEPGRA